MTMSTTARVMYPAAQQPSGWKEAMQEFSGFGEVARTDFSLAAVVGSALVTFYDVRATKQLLVELAGRAEAFPGLPHDFRAVRVDMAAAKMGAIVGFGSFGAVANCSVVDGDVVVEYFDMRAAQRLLAAVRPCGMPWPPMTEGSGASLAKMTMQIQTSPFEPLSVQGGLPSVAPQVLNDVMWPPMTEGLAASLAQMLMSQSEPPWLQGGHPSVAPQALSDGLFSTPETVEQLAQPKNIEPSQAGAPSSMKRRSIQKGKTKVTGADFSKFDILPEMIQTGKDSRTTVMVRNLVWASARQDFLNLLEDIGLSDRYTFFYMPCKEHSNELASFAFVNFVAPHDVNVLHSKVAGSTWRKAYNDRFGKAPAVSYASYQGHEKLLQLFRSTAVLNEHDPEKRPIFRPNAGQDYEEYADCHPAFVPSPNPQQIVDGNDLPSLPDMLAKLKI